jgi:hypothetical protein
MSTEPSAGSRILSGTCECSAFKPFAGIERDRLEITDGAETLLVWGEESANHTRSSTTRRFDRRFTSSSARRRRGSRSATICRSRRSTRSKPESTVPRGLGIRRRHLGRSPTGFQPLRGLHPAGPLQPAATRSGDSPAREGARPEPRHARLSEESRRTPSVHASRWIQAKATTPQLPMLRLTWSSTRPRSSMNA